MAPNRTKCFDVDSPTHSDHSEASESAEGPVQKVSAFKPYARPSTSTQSGPAASSLYSKLKALSQEGNLASARAGAAHGTGSAQPRQTREAERPSRSPEILGFVTQHSVLTGEYAEAQAASEQAERQGVVQQPQQPQAATSIGRPLHPPGSAPPSTGPMLLPAGPPGSTYSNAQPFDAPARQQSGPSRQAPSLQPPQGDPTPRPGRHEVVCLAPCLSCQRPWSMAEEHRFVEIVSLTPKYQIFLLLSESIQARLGGVPLAMWSAIARELCPMNPRTAQELSQRWTDIRDGFHDLHERLAPSGRDKTLAQLAKCTRAYHQRLHFCSINSWFELYHAMLLSLPNVIEVQKQITDGASRVQGASPAAAAAAAVASGKSPVVNAAASSSSAAGPAAASSSAQPNVFISSSTDAAAKDERAHQLAVLAAQNEQRRTELEIAKLNVRREELVLAREEKARDAARQVAAAKPNVAVDEEEREHPERVDEFVKSQTLVFVALMDRFDEVDEAIEEVRNKQRYP